MSAAADKVLIVTCTALQVSLGHARACFAPGRRAGAEHAYRGTSIDVGYGGYAA